VITDPYPAPPQVHIGLWRARLDGNNPFRGMCARRTNLMNATFIRIFMMKETFIRGK
jgi:hypothetical protein